jgi:hypothetical protein
MNSLRKSAGKAVPLTRERLDREQGILRTQIKPDYARQNRPGRTGHRGDWGRIPTFRPGMVDESAGEVR